METITVNKGHDTGAQQMPAAWQPLSTDRAALMSTYEPLTPEFVRGEGATVWDRAGHAYLDAVAGIGVTNVGHSHPRITAAIQDQAQQILHTSNLYQNSWQAQLARRLTALSGLEKAFICNSGAEANEAAVKLARRYAVQRGIAEPLIVVMQNAFHGRTMATLSASDSAPVRDGFGPLLGGFIAIPFGDLAALDAVAAEYGERIVAVFCETVQGEGGVHLPPPGYLPALRAFCDARNCLLMLDEIQSGLGRTGRWFACQHDDVLPDVMTVAKALGNGIPVAACLARGVSAALFKPGSHGTTFGGNPFASRVACTVLDILEEEALVAQAAVRGAALLQRLQQALGQHPNVRAVRGIGLMIGIEMQQPCKYLMQEALNSHRLLINVTRQTVIRLLPPLTLTDEESGHIVSALTALIV